MSTDYTTLGLGAAVGLALGLGIGAVTSNPDLGKLRSAFSDEVGAIAEDTSETVTDAVAEVSAKIDALSGSVDEKFAGSQTRMAETVAGLQARIDALGAAVEESRSAGAGAAETMSASLAEMRGTLEAMGTRLAALETGTAPAEAPAEPAPAAAAEAEETIDGTTAGRVEMFADGALRVFVSAVDEADGTARVAINGIETQVIRVGRSATVEVDGQPCSVTIDAIVEGHVQMTGDCGGAS